MHVLVTGGTGALGRPVVTQLRAAGHQVRVLSRRAGVSNDWIQGDLATGTGLDRAVAGVDVIIHAGSATTQPMQYDATDIDGTRRLLAAAQSAGVAHLVFVSIVGMEGIHYRYYEVKLHAEALVKAGPVPWSILRATQFHTLTDRIIAAMCRLPGLALVPRRWQLQPVDVNDVAARLVDVAAGAPGGMLPDFGGPEVRTFDSLAHSWLAAHRARKRLVNLPIPLQFSRRFAAGALLCPDHRDGTVTWEQYLQRNVPPS